MTFDTIHQALISHTGASGACRRSRADANQIAHSVFISGDELQQPSSAAKTGLVSPSSNLASGTFGLAQEYRSMLVST